jgi:hypothetical protein
MKNSKNKNQNLKIKEAKKYLENAREILKSIPIESDVYVDKKRVREACGTAYLAILEAIDEYLLNHGISKDKLPRSVDAYRDVLRKHLLVHNGKLLKNFEALYEELHIAGYYRGNLRSVEVLKGLIKSAEKFIEKIP